MRIGSPSFIGPLTANASGAFNDISALKIIASGQMTVGQPTGPYRLTMSPAANFFAADTTAGQIAVYSTDAAASGVGGSLSLGAENTFAGGATSPYICGQIKGGKDIPVDSWNGFLSFSTSDTGSYIRERMRIDCSGHVGIGTQYPKHSLEVNGWVKASGYYGDGSQLSGIAAGATTVTFVNADLVDGIYTITGDKIVVEVRNGSDYKIWPDDEYLSGGNTLLDFTSFGTLIGTYKAKYL